MSNTKALRATLMSTLGVLGALALHACGGDEPPATSTAGSSSGDVGSSTSASSTSSSSGGTGGEGVGGAGDAGGTGGAGGGDGGSGGVGGSGGTGGQGGDGAGGDGGAGSVTEVNCSDGADNDQDGLHDCEDVSDCSSDAVACPIMAECAEAALTIQPMAGYCDGAGDVQTLSKHFSGSCGGSSLTPGFVFGVSAPADGVLLYGHLPGFGVYVRTTCDDPSSEVLCTTTPPPNNANRSLRIGTGETAWLFVDTLNPNQSGSVGFCMSLEPRSDIEPNDAPMQGNTMATPFWGWIHPSMDVDYIKISVPGPSSTIKAETSQSNCDLPSGNTEIEIYDQDGVTSLAYNDDNGADYCSLATASNLPAGTYYVRVAASAASSSATFAYNLNVTVL